MKKIQCCLLIVAIVLFSCQAGWAKEKLTAQDWLQKGMELEKQYVYDEAILMYTQAIKADKNYSEAYFKRAKARMASHRSNAMEALNDFNRAIELNPTNAEAYYERGLLNVFILNNESARDDMRTAAALGHTGAQKWLAPGTEGKSEEKQRTAMRAAPATNREEVPNSPPAGTQETGKEKRETTYPDLREYLSSASEPMIHFDFNMSTIKQQDYAILDDIALALKEKIPDANIIVAGYADSTGTEQYNDHLSLQRARAVETYLTGKHGISPDRISVKGYGKSAPVATNETEEGRAQNRRVELLLVGK